MDKVAQIDWETLRLDTPERRHAFARLAEQVGRAAAKEAWEETLRLERQEKQTTQPAK